MSYTNMIPIGDWLNTITTDLEKLGLKLQDLQIEALPILAPGMNQAWKLSLIWIEVDLEDSKSVVPKL